MPAITRSIIRTTRFGLPLLATAAFVAACGSSGSGGGPAGATPAAGSAATSIEVSNGHLADGTGRTVYLWVADTAGTSTCTGACARVWPPVLGSGGSSAGSGVATAKVTTVARGDGTTQLVYAGHPLYYYAADSAAGDTHGQGSDSFGAKWWEVAADGQAITGAGAASQSAPAPGGYNY